MTDIGILAYGSLILDAGTEISPLIERRIATMTPFLVEYARLSKKRGGAPTVVPHSSGCPVKAEILVLPNSIPLEEAKNMLWRRETRREGSGQAYRERSSPDTVLIRDKPGFCCLNHVLFTDFNDAGKLSNPDPKILAKAAVDSVAIAPRGKDGISYLMNLISAGVMTLLTPGYQAEILALTESTTLSEAYCLARARQPVIQK